MTAEQFIRDNVNPDRGGYRPDEVAQLIRLALAGRSTVSLLYHKPLKGSETPPSHLIGVYSDQVAARAGVDRYRDGCDHPPDEDQFLILEKPILTVSG